MKFKARIFPKPLTISVKRKKCGRTGEERERRFCRKDRKVPCVVVLQSLKGQARCGKANLPRTE